MMSRMFSTFRTALFFALLSILVPAPSMADVPAETARRLADRFAPAGNLPADPMVRIVWVTLPSADETADNRLRDLAEAARDIPRLDVAPTDVGLYFVKRLKEQGEGDMAAAEGAIAAMGRRRLLAEAGAAYMVVAGAKGNEITLTVFGADGVGVASIVDQWAPSATSADTTPADGTPAGSATSIATEGKGMFTRPWGGKIALLGADRTRNMAVRDRAPIRRYPVSGVVSSATTVAIPGRDGTMVALLVDGKVRLTVVEGDALTLVTEADAVGSSTPVSLIAFDVDGDGTDEIVVNAYDDEGLAAYLLAYDGRRLRTTAQGIPYFFSAAADDTLLAQEGMEGTPIPGPTLARVVSEEGKLRYVASVKLAPTERVIGVGRFDIDGDGAAELAGMTERGDLILYTLGGEIAWKGSGFGYTGRRITLKPAGRRATSVVVPPRVVMIDDPNLGRLLAVAGASYSEGGIFSSARLVLGTVRFVRLRGDDYVVEDSYTDAEGYISDLIPMGRGAGGRNDAVGFVAVERGVVGSVSVVALPIR
jgi:hypothetical protein